MAVDLVQLVTDSATIIASILAAWKSIANKVGKLDKRIERLEDMVFQALLQRLTEYNGRAPSTRT